MSGKVAVVTGSNKGIGLAIVKGLCEKFEGDVYLTSRDVTRGQNAVKKLNEQGLHPLYHQLDVTDPASITKFRDFLKQKHGGIDVLINNAGIYLGPKSPESLEVRAQKTMDVNYFSIVSVCSILFPILKPNARVVHVSSAVGHLSLMPAGNTKNKIGDKSLTEPLLSNLVNEYINAVKKGTHIEDGWLECPYFVSKIALCALTFIQHREYGDKGFIINCLNPGYVATDLNDNKGYLTTEQGSEAALYLALDAPDDLKGIFMWNDKQIVDWYGTPPPLI